MRKLRAYPKIIVGIGLLILLFVFNASRRPISSETERKYESWLSEVQTKVETSGSASPDLPEISIQISSTTIPSLNWEIHTSKDPEDTDTNDRVIRLLDLIKESNILKSSRSESAEIHLVVNEREKEFTVHFDRSDAEKNLQLASMLKLFQIYVLNAPTKAPSEHLSHAGIQQ